MTAVTQTWMHSISFMQQTVVMALTRGPDTLPKYHPAKYLMRWARRCFLVSALDGCVLTKPYNIGDSTEGGSFTGPSYRYADHSGDAWEGPMDDVVAQYLRSVDEIPHHFHLHFVHGAEIIGYKHSDVRIRRWWHKVYTRLVHDMHLYPELEVQLDARLGDSREGWLARADMATIA